MTARPAYRNVSPDEARQMFEAGEVTVLDVRTPEEYRQLGHIPGSLLLPVQLVACAPATLPADGKPLLVCCEHGVRSARAAALLTRAGFPEVRNLVGGMAAWSGPREFVEGSPHAPVGPSSWLLANADLLPPGGRVLDVACGRGRNALLLAAAGFPVHAVDRDGEKIAALADAAGRLGLPVTAEVLDLEAGDPDLGEVPHDVVLGIHYLHRPLFPRLVRAAGRLLIWETFLEAQAERGHPTDPEFLLGPGELPRLVAPMVVVRSREGEHEERLVSGVVARPASS